MLQRMHMHVAGWSTAKGEKKHIPLRLRTCVHELMAALKQRESEASRSERRARALMGYDCQGSLERASSSCASDNKKGPVSRALILSRSARS